MRSARLVALALLAAAPLAAQAPRAGRPEGWRWRYDRANAVDSTLEFVTMSPGWHITTGPSGILYNPAQTARGTYRVESRIFLFPGGEHAEGFGLFIGGRNLDGADQNYTYFLIRRDGRFMVRQRTGATTRDVIGWTANEAVTPHPGDSTNVRNELAVEVAADSVRFLVNNRQVHAAGRSAIPTDGQVGLRVNHGLNLHVSRLEITPR